MSPEKLLNFLASSNVDEKRLSDGDLRTICRSSFRLARLAVGVGERAIKTASNAGSRGERQKRKPQQKTQ